MSALNPYGRYLDGRPLEVILDSTPNRVATLLDSMGKAKVVASPAPGKWSPAEIVCHLADCELVFAFRLRQTLAEDAPVIQPFDQEKWAAAYHAVNVIAAMDVFRATRAWNLLLIASALPAAAGRAVTHPERGVMTFQTLVETIAGHDLNHLGQLERIAMA